MQQVPAPTASLTTLDKNLSYIVAPEKKNIRSAPTKRATIPMFKQTGKVSLELVFGPNPEFALNYQHLRAKQDNIFDIQAVSLDL